MPNWAVKQGCCSATIEIDKFQIRKSPNIAVRAYRMLAERTGLEPATPGVTGRYSNQLNYRSFSLTFAR